MAKTHLEERGRYGTAHCALAHIYAREIRSSREQVTIYYTGMNCNGKKKNRYENMLREMRILASDKIKSLDLSQKKELSEKDDEKLKKIREDYEQKLEASALTGTTLSAAPVARPDQALVAAEGLVDGAGPWAGLLKQRGGARQQRR